MFEVGVEGGVEVYQVDKKEKEFQTFDLVQVQEEWEDCSYL